MVKVANLLLSSRDKYSSIHQLSSGLLEPEEGVSVLEELDILFGTTNDHFTRNDGANVSRTLNIH